MTATTLAQIAELTDQKLRLDQYKAKLQQILQKGELSEVHEFVDHALSDRVPMVLSRALLQQLVATMSALTLDSQITVATYALEKAQPRLVSLEEQLLQLREKLAELHEQQENWSKAAHVLAGMDLESGARQDDVEYKLQKHIKIAMLYLEDDDPVSADVYIKKASALVAAAKNPALELQYKTCSARILDSKRKFLEAAVRYYELSQISNKVFGELLDEDDLQQALVAAVTCIILAPPGPQRSRLLAQLYKDERCTKLPLYDFLKKVYMGRILTPSEVSMFADTLREHQRAVLPDGSTVLDRAVMEHNLAAASKLYLNIYSRELGALLGVAPDKAELVASQMIAADRLPGRIDQVSGLITFHGGSGEGTLHTWDQQIQDLCSRVNDLTAAISSKGLLPESMMTSV